MDLTNKERVFKLIKNLATNPDLLIPYARMSIFSRKLPIDLNVPWWSFRAIERADKLIPGKIVFEFGSGGSTLRYAQWAKSITCVEDDENWGRIIENRLFQKLLNNVDIIYQYFDFTHPENFYKSDYLTTFDGSKGYDVVIIDGQDKSFHERITCFEYVEPAMLNHGCIIVDDFWRYTVLLKSHHATKVDIYESVGPCRFGVTSTAFFLYGKIS